MINFFKYHYYKLFSTKIPKESFDLDILQPYCIMFGSRLWGGATRKSDVDFIIREEDTTILLTKLASTNYVIKISRESYSDVLRSLSFIHEGYTYSISVLSSENFSIYKKAILLMTEFSLNNPLVNDHKYRRGYFEYFMEFFTYNKRKLPTDLLQFIQSKHPELLL